MMVAINPYNFVPLTMAEGRARSWLGHKTWLMSTQRRTGLQRSVAGTLTYFRTADDTQPSS